MKTHSEWITFFREDIGFDPGMIWHMMEGMYGLGLVKKPHVHTWSEWKEIGRTGDWFHPLIVERKCACGATETDEH